VRRLVAALDRELQLKTKRRQVAALQSQPSLEVLCPVEIWFHLASGFIPDTNWLRAYYEGRKTLDLTSLKTPSLVLDLAILERNAKRIGAIAQANGVSLRPHVKTHKCVEVARIQTRGHSGAITVSTLAEARAFAAQGFDDVTYAVPIEPGKFNEVVELIRKGTKLSLITDTAELPELLDKLARDEGIQLDVFLKVDCGYHRCGVEPNSREAFDIPRLITEAKNLRFAGILTHAGHSYNCKSKAELLDVTRHERDSMLQLAAGLRDAGFEVPTVSIGPRRRSHISIIAPE